METTIPYHPGFLLGRSVDMKSLQMGYMLIGEEILPTSPQVNLTTSQFSFISSLKDVCDILRIPLEYALKVKARQIENESVSACLRCIGREDSFSLIFRTSFLQQKQYLSQDVIPVRSKSGETRMSGEGEGREPTTESLISDAIADSPSGSSAGSMGRHGSHWVKALEIGNELISVMTVSSKDIEKRQKLHYKICECLQAYRGLFDNDKLAALNKVASDIDKKLSKKHYSDVSLAIQYCSFDELPKYPASFEGLLKTMENFMDQCVGWAEGYKHGKLCDVESALMRCRDGVDVEEKLSVKDSLMKKISDFHFGAPSAVAYHPQKEANGEPGEDEDEEDRDSFVVLDSSSSRFMYHLRVTLQSFEGEQDADVFASLSSLALTQYPESTYNLFERLYKLLVNCDMAAELIQRFLGSHRFLVDNRVEEGNQVLKAIQSVQMTVYNTVSELNLVSIPTEETLENVLTSNPLDTVTLFIENVTSKLPPGSDLDLLMIGKTGHGKSSTGNSILGQNRFVCSSAGDSVTNRTTVGWSEVDGRTIKVVDTPGVCDTNVETEGSSIDLAIQSISEAIANCPEGFHALLLIIRFGIRMTAEEKKAIALLKCVLGDDVIKSHSVCVITYGDNFEKEMVETKTDFETWCRTQKGFLKELFEECNYRCVLFNNKAEDAKARKAQLIKLIANVDTLKGNGTRYTNSLFDIAQQERRRVIAEERVPQVSEEMMRDIQVVLEYLSVMVRNTSQQDQYKDELAKLKAKVDNLTNRVSEVEGEQLGNLVDTVFNLAGTIHEKMDEIADRPQGDQPDDIAAGTVGGGAAAEDTGVKRAESPWDNKTLDKFREDLQDYVNTEISPKASMVTEKVSEKVREEVKKDGKECFPGSSMVVLASGKSVALEDLQVGDKVQVRDGFGKLGFDMVYMFGHQEHEVYSSFIVLETVSQNVSVTRGHYVYCEREEQELCIAAKDVRVGDRLVVATSTGFDAQPVTKVRVERKQGLFAPFTLNGSVVVDGALMSCYIDVLQPRTCHTLLWPLRQLFGLSPGALSRINGSTVKHPVPLWARAAMKIM